MYILTMNIHYRKSLLCRATNPHGKGFAEPGKEFAVRNNTAKLARHNSRRQRLFAVCFSENTRQSIRRVFFPPHSKVKQFAVCFFTIFAVCFLLHPANR